MAEQTTQPGKEAVGTGTNTLESTGNKKLDARKTIMALADSSREAEVGIDTDTHPSAAAIAQAIAEASGGELSEEDARAVTPESLLAMQEEIEGDAGIRETGEPIVEEVAAAVVAPTTGTPAVTPPGEEDVALTVFGQTVYLPKSEVDARGGIAATQQMLAADHRFRQATQLAEDAKRLHTAAATKLSEAQALENSLLAQSSAAGTPAARQPGQPTKPAPADDSIRAAAVKKLVGEMWKGDPRATEAALNDVFAMIQTRGGNAPTAEQIAALVQTKVEATLLRQRADDRTAQVNNARQRETDEVNHLMATKYAVIDKDSTLRAMARGLFRDARADARNKGRSLVSIADDVGARMLEVVGLPSGEGSPASAAAPAAVRQEMRTRTTLKRRLPQPSTASERSPVTDQEPNYPTKASDVVRMLRAARGQTN
jgi:hypothetical protein